MKEFNYYIIGFVIIIAGIGIFGHSHIIEHEHGQLTGILVVIGGIVKMYYVNHKMGHWVEREHSSNRDWYDERREELRVMDYKLTLKEAELKERQYDLQAKRHQFERMVEDKKKELGID